MSESPAQVLARELGPDGLSDYIARLSPDDAVALKYNWRFWARPEQIPPQKMGWIGFLEISGRGSGKTRAGCEAVREAIDHVERVALVAPTAADARDVLVQGDGALESIFPPDQKPFYEPTKRRVTFHNGAVAFLYSGEEPDRLRGPQHGFALCDELASWKYSQATFDNLMLGLRLGRWPRYMVTTTPRPIRLLRDLLSRPNVVVRKMTTYDNRANLPEQFINEIVAKYEGTRLGRQEIYAEILEDVEGALWTTEEIEECTILPADKPEITRIVIGLDPSTGSGAGDECGLMVCGLGTDGNGYVLADLSLRGSPSEWGKAVVSACRTWNPDRIVCEKNFGQEQLARLVVDPLAVVPWKFINVHQAKEIRAEPVKSLYEQRRIFHCGSFAKLESQQTTWVPVSRGGPKDESPDRLDACLELGTLVTTVDGERAIESIIEGDFVLTRSGYRRVSWAGMTQKAARIYEVKFSNGRVIRGTPEHPVLRGGEFVRLDALIVDDIVLSCHESVKNPAGKIVRRSSTTDRFTSDIRKQLPVLTGSTSGRWQVGTQLRKLSMLRFGKMLSALFHAVSSSIMQTGILSTTTLLTWNVWTRKLIPSVIRQTISAHPSTWRTLLKYVLSPLRGIAAKKGAPGIASTERRLGPRGYLHLKLLVSGVGQRFFDIARTPLSVPRFVGADISQHRKEREDHPSQNLSSRSALLADGHFARRIPQFSHARVVAVGITEECNKVFNLSIEDEPEFFANGVLVHNCVAALTELLVKRAYGPATVVSLAGIEQLVIPQR